jgi:ABC-type sugar transport system, periplasmic component
MYKWLKENMNVDINVSCFFDSDYTKTYEKMNLMLASGEIPDVVSVLTGKGIENKWGEAGLIIPMDDWMKKYPDLVKNADSKYDDVQYRDQKDGKMYIIPTQITDNTDSKTCDVGPFIREDWLKQIGMQAPTNTDELYAVLKAFKDKIPDVNGKKIIPATFDDYRSFVFFAWTHFIKWYDSNTRKFNWFFMDPEIENYMVYMNKLYREGLLDKEMFTDKFEQYQEKLGSGRVGFTTRVWWDMDTANKALKTIDPNARFIASPPLRVPGKDFVAMGATESPAAYTGIAVSAKFARNERNLERLMEFLNWESSSEGTLKLETGDEGQYYTKNDKGQLILKPEYNAELKKQNSTFYADTGLKYYDMMKMVIPDMANPDMTEESLASMSVWKESVGTFIKEISMTPDGPLEQQKLGGLIGEFNKWSAKAIYASSEDECRKLTQEMLKAFETNGGRDITNEKQKAIDDYLAKNP